MIFSHHLVFSLSLSLLLAFSFVLWHSTDLDHQTLIFFSMFCWPLIIIFRLIIQIYNIWKYYYVKKYDLMNAILIRTCTERELNSVVWRGRNMMDNNQCKQIIFALFFIETIPNLDVIYEFIHFGLWIYLSSFG